MRLVKPKTERAEVPRVGATELLREDHGKLKKIFDEFERTEDSVAKKRLVEKALVEMTVHARIEERIFYPAARKHAQDDELLNESLEEHHVAEVLIGELAAMRPSDPRYDAKFLVLAESVRRHIEEEEGELFPKLEGSGFDLESVGQEMDELKESLLARTDLASIKREAGRRRPAASRPGGRRSRRSARGATSRRVASAGRAKSRA